MPRIARGLHGGYIYHVLNRGNAKQEVFHKPQDYEAFVFLMREAKKRISIKILAYCLMPNHFHLIVMPPNSESLSKWMQWLMTSHVRRYHKHYDTSGHIWQGRFKSFHIEEDNHLLTVLRYVEGNPVRAGLVRTVKEWPWCSHLERIGEKSQFLVDDLPIELPRGWSQYVDTPLTEKALEELRQSLLRQSPFGTKDWQEHTAKTLGLESTLRPRGRPQRIKLTPPV